MEQPQTTKYDAQRGYREDELATVMRAHQSGITAEELVAGAERVRTFMEQKGRPDWADVAQFADITAERDRARATAVRLEQEVAAHDGAQELAMKGALLQVLHEATNFGKQDLAAVRTAVGDAAKKFGITL
ncbi:MULTISPECIES: hypothetical protein [unclassified Leucobacter]|uniref:hypothetical protein n=1 Tax=unclassified Leucobacter TaxID=2621730 RepID=UPI0006220D8C|nr:hypothetical protein [Leucobacter sp. Ag1]KKI16397.1 hypothetical protein XM48_16545 [Leucobacter sp. Ag1]